MSICILASSWQLVTKVEEEPLAGSIPQSSALEIVKSMSNFKGFPIGEIPKNILTKIAQFLPQRIDENTFVQCIDTMYSKKPKNKQYNIEPNLKYEISSESQD